MEKRNWGVIGTGAIAHEMAAALRRVNGEIYAVCGTSPEKARRFAEECGVKKAHGSAEELIADPEVGIVYIAVPHSCHCEYLLKALQAGKHVLCEKAVTVNSRQLEECVAVAEKSGLVICDGTTLLHMPLYKKLRRLVDDGAIGAVRMIQVNFGSCKEYDETNRFFAKDLAGGALLDIGVYAASFARFFMESSPDLVLTTAEFAATGVDETSGILLKNSAGQMAVIALTLRAKQPKRGVIAGEKGFIEICEYPRAQRATITYTESGRTEVIEEGESSRALDYEVLDMQEYVRTGGGGENLRMVRDVMEILTAVRSRWGMVYPFE